MKMSIKKIALVIAVPLVSAFSNAALAEQSTLCKFYSGGYAGHIIDYSGMGYTLAVGRACNDGQGGQGVIVSRYESQGQSNLQGPRYTLIGMPPTHEDEYFYEEQQDEYFYEEQQDEYFYEEQY